MPAIDRITAFAVITATTGSLITRAVVSWLTFRRLRRVNELLEKAIRELDHERIS